MKIQKEHLMPALDVLIGISNRRTTLPILNYFRIESVDGEMLKISASNLDQFAEQLVRCDGKIDACCISANQFYLLAKSAVETITVEPSNNGVNVTGNGTKLLKTLSAEEFVPMPDDKQVKQSCDCVELAECVESVAFAAASESETRFVLQHVSATFEPTKTTVQASNARIIASITQPAISGEAKLLCHADFVASFCKYLRSEGATLSIGTNFFSVESESGAWFGKLPDAQWNKTGIDSMLNTKKEKIGSVNVDEVRSAIELASSLSRSNSNQSFVSASLDFKPKALVFSSDDYEKEILGSFNKLETKISMESLSESFRNIKADEATILYGESKVFIEAGDMILVLATLKK